MQRKIMVIGATGFIGKNLTEYLYKYNTQDDVLEVSRYISRTGRHFSCDITVKEQVSRLFEFYQPTHIIHLAADSSSRNSTSAIFDSNLKGTYNLLECCKGNPDFIFASSILVYGSIFGSFYETDTCVPNSLYGITKLACEHMVNLYYKKGKVRPRILRLCGNVGKHLSHGRLYEALSGKKDFTLWGNSPGAYIPYLHISDTVKAIIKTLNSNKSNITYNICPSDNISLNDTFSLVEKVSGTKLNLTWNNSDEFLNREEYICCDNTRAVYDLGWNPTYNSKEAITVGLEDILGLNEVKC